jgi:hypothetical protein
LAERCAKGQELFDTRAKAVAATEGLGIGSVAGQPNTPEQMAENQAADDAMAQVAAPASNYNDHVADCQKCKDFDSALVV